MKVNVFLLSLVCGFFLFTSARAATVGGPVVNPANGHTYYLLSANSWTASQAEAQTLGGNLVTINDAMENDWVLNTFALSGPTIRDLWIGLNDAANEGTYVWASMETPNFFNWVPGEPNDGAGAGEDYVHLYGGGQPAHAPGWVAGRWNDFANQSSYATFGGDRNIFGVVELAAVPEPSTWALLGLGGLAALWRGRRASRSR